MIVVVAIALGKLGLHCFFNNRYGYFRDEFNYLSSGNHLAWGYVDQSPLLPFLVRVSRALLGDSLRSIRFLPALAIHLPRGTALAAGTVAADLNVAGATNGLVTAGAVGLFNAKLVGFDLGAKVRAISGFSGLNTGRDLDIHSLTTNVRISPPAVNAC